MSTTGAAQGDFEGLMILFFNISLINLSMSFALVEVEALLKLKLLTHIAVDPQDKELLTPNHFLLKI